MTEQSWTARLEMIERRLKSKWPNLYTRSYPDVAYLVIYGSTELAAEAAEYALKLAADTPIHIEVQKAVLCSKSAPFSPSMGAPGQVEYKVQPKPVGQDKRGVTLECSGSRADHEHDWGDYQPLDGEVH